MTSPAPIDSPLTPLSETQRAAWAERRLAPREEVAPDVWALAMPIMGGSMPYTLCYALLDETGGVHLIDPGWGSDANIEVLTVELAGIGRAVSDVRTVIATHSHPDHLGLAPRLRAETGATIILSDPERAVLAQEDQPGESARKAFAQALDRWGVPAEHHEELTSFYRIPYGLENFAPDRTVVDGELIEIPGHRLQVVLTPGHTSGHLCLLDPDRALFYSGDHVLPRIVPGVGLGVLPDTDPLDDYLGSLARVEAWDDLQVLPGHEYRFHGLARRSRAIADHHLRRTQALADLVDELADAPAWEYARRMTWARGKWDTVSGFVLYSALHQTDLHRHFVKSRRWAAHVHSEGL